MLVFGVWGLLFVKCVCVFVLRLSFACAVVWSVLLLRRCSALVACCCLLYCLFVYAFVACSSLLVAVCCLLFVVWSLLRLVCVA